MHRWIAVALSAGLCLSAAAAQETAADRWNLADVYPSAQAWQGDADQLNRQLADFGRCRGHLGDGAARLRGCLDLRADLTKRFLRLRLFSDQQLAQDVGSAASLALSQKAALLGNQVKLASAFVDPEMLAIGPERIKTFMAEDPGLRIHAFPIERILRQAAHTLDGAGESLVAQFGNMSDTGESVYGVLANADMPWPKLRLASGEEVVLDQSAYTKAREAGNRDIANGSWTPSLEPSRVSSARWA